jgi:hypothetical protein
MLGGVTGEVDREDAEDLCAMLVAQGRLVPAQQWVDVLVDRAESERMEGLF